MLLITPYTPPNFLTPVGAWKMLKRLKKRGFPSVRNWRFVTLTINRDDYGSPEEAYYHGKQKLRNFIAQLRNDYAITRWCWKLEFHLPDTNGEMFPHWHLLIDYKRPIDVNDITQAWGLGRTQIKRVDGESFEYLFKYVAKSTDSLPDYILNLKQARFFQTSQKFFTGNGENEKQEPSLRLAATPSAKTKNGGSINSTIGERLQKWQKLAVARTEIISGVFRYSTLKLSSSWGHFRLNMCLTKFEHNVPEQILHIQSHKIQTSCPSLLACQPT